MQENLRSTVGQYPTSQGRAPHPSLKMRIGGGRAPRGSMPSVDNRYLRSVTARHYNQKMRIERRKVALLGSVVGLCIMVVFVAIPPGLWTISSGSSSADDNKALDNVAGVNEPLAVDHAVWGYVTDISGNPVPDSTVVNITVFHIDHYTTYETSGTSSGWYSYVLGYGEQGTNWDVGDYIWANVTHMGIMYANQTTITSTSNQQIDVRCDVPIPEFGMMPLVVMGLLVVIVLGVSRRKNAWLP